MTKTEFKAQGVDALREALLDLFEDEDGSLAGANKAGLTQFVDDNWDYIDSQLNPVEEDEDAEEEAEEVEEAEDDEEEVEEVLDLTKPNPRTDLYTGRIGG